MLLLTLALALVQAAPTHDELAAKFVASLPPSGGEPSPNETILGRANDLIQKYPAKEASIRARFADREACSVAKTKEGTNRLMLATAQSLTDAELTSLIAFYSGPDYARLDDIKEGTPEWDALLKKYPLTRFSEAMKAEVDKNLLTDVFAAEGACDDVLKAALAKEGVEE